MRVSEETDVVLVGGGPVGLFLACALTLRGISCIVLEKRPEIGTHSRAIGIHPPALVALAAIGVVPLLIHRGVRIHRARGYYGRHPLTAIDFAAALPPPFNFVLALPQTQTESVLQGRLEALAPNTLRRNTTCEGFTQNGNQLQVTYSVDGEPRLLRTRFLVGCDGIHSRVRESAGIAFPQCAYPDRYRMGDFADTTHLGTDAVLFLSPAGIVESFPLPDGLRRWVVHIGNAPQSEPSPVELVSEVQRRTGLTIPPDTCTMLSSFGVASACAETLVKGAVCLVGDAAHICSPMGGQGMNLGILGAAQLADCLQSALHHTNDALAHYNIQQRKQASTVLQRAAFNTRMGRGGQSTVFPALVFAALFHLPPIHDYFARRFTMQDLCPPRSRNRQSVPDHSLQM
jgi:2-polyprenyl-6-methoxyphenol hydroxylase-like FAD-dependent oxidoreductase